MIDLSKDMGISKEDLEATPQSVLDLIGVLLGQIRAQAKRIEDIEARLGKNSSNSSKPPSSDSPYRKARHKSENRGGDEKKREKGKPGAKPGHKGHSQKLLEPTETRVIEPPACPCGCGEFKNQRAFYTHQELELPIIEMIVRHFTLMEGQCANCGRTSKGVVPQAHRTGYGPRLTGMIGELGGIDGNSRSTIQAFCRSVLKIPVSLGAIQNMIDRVSRAIEPHYDKIAETARETEINHVDETSWRQNGALKWLWVMAGSLASLFMIHEKRSREAFEELIGGWMGILVSDGYGVYRKWVGLRQTCLAHLIRDAKGLEERADPALAKFGKWARAELRRLCAMAEKKPAKKEWLAFYARFSRLISMHYALDNDAGVFARRLSREMEHLFVFLKKEGVEPTNNFAERMLRFAVLWRRCGQGTRGDKGDRWVERILSVRQTCRMRGVSSYEVLVDAMEHYLNGDQPDVSWIGHAA